MFKVAVLSLLVLGCSALPYQHSGFRSYGGQQSFLTSQPRIVGLNSGYSGYRSGLSSGSFLGSGYGSGYGLGSGYSTYGSGLQFGGLRSGYGYGSGAILAAAPVATAQVVAAPIATTQVLTAAPAIQSIGYSQNLGLNQNVGLNLLNVRQGEQFQQVVPAAIQQISRTVEYRPFANQEQPIQAQVVEVEPSDNPVHLHFKTRSSTLSASQSHQAAGATEVQTAAAQDEPQRLLTEVQKPVIQEVKEIISPFRQVTQEINPVVESLHTIVTKGEGHRQQYAAQQFVAPQQFQAASYQTVQAAPALQTFAVQTPTIQTVAAPLQTLAVQAAPVAVETVAVQAAPALQTIAVQSPISSYQTSYSGASPSYSTLNIGSQKSFGFQSALKPISSGSYSSYSSSGY